MIEYTKDNGKIRRVAIIDHKDGSNFDPHYNKMAYEFYQDLASDLQLPFFTCEDYLDPVRFWVPCFYLIPENDLAKQLLISFGRDKKWNNPSSPGIWLSIYDEARLRSFIRGQTFDPMEVRKVPERLQVLFGEAWKVGDLPKQVKIYAWEAA